MNVYANEWDKDAAHWLSCLPLQFDEIDTRSIEFVQGSEIAHYDQCHFFAGIGGWPLALEIAGWPNDARVWTGSCPCQPFSQAGKRKGTADERHLWPEFRRLIDECRPPTIFGEQVASKAGRDWLAVVRADLEALGYAVGAANLSAASVGAPHIRQRLFWVAHRDSRGQQKHSEQYSYSIESTQQAPSRGDAYGRCNAGRMANTGRDRSDKGRRHDNGMDSQERSEQVINDQSSSGMGYTESNGLGQSIKDRSAGHGSNSRLGDTHSGTKQQRNISFAQYVHSYAVTEFIECRDGKARPVKPGVRLLAHGIPGRVAQLRGLGNAIVPALAAEFIKAFMEVSNSEVG